MLLSRPYEIVPASEFVYVMKNILMCLPKLCFFPTKYSVDVGEDLSLFYALQWLALMQFDSVDFMTDSKVTTDEFDKRKI